MGKRKKKAKTAYLQRFSAAALNHGGYTPHKPTLHELSRRAKSGVSLRHDPDNMAREVVVEDLPPTRGVPVGLSPAEVTKKVLELHERQKTWWARVSTWPWIYLRKGTNSSWRMFYKNSRYVLVRDDNIRQTISVSHPFSNRDEAMKYFGLGETLIAWELVDLDVRPLRDQKTEHVLAIDELKAKTKKVFY